MQHVDEVIIHLTIKGELIETTPEHPFLTDDGLWVNAGELQVGEQILSLGGVYGTVEAVEVIQDANQPIYLTVEEVHTFTVGDGEWVVHNENPQTWNCINPIYSLDNLGDPNDVLVVKLQHVSML